MTVLASPSVKKLRDHGIPTEHGVFVIAEIGINHGGNIETAKRLIDAAQEAGVDAVKFQTYRTEQRVPADSPIFDILKKCELPLQAFQELQEYSKQYSLTFFSTPFDRESAEYLASIDCGLYKIASFDIVNQQLIDVVASFGKPMIMSIGMATLPEVEVAYTLAKKKTPHVSLLHCISAYPTMETDANLAAIHTLRARFDCVIGQSDHTNDIGIPLYAVAVGSQIIEKHFKIDDVMDCIDAPVSITKKQMTALVQEVRRLERILGDGRVGPTEAQKGILQYRRPTSLV